MERIWLVLKSSILMPCVSCRAAACALKSVTFTFSQAGDNAGTKVSEASDTAKVAGNAAKLSFTDSWGNQVRGNMTFDQGKLYLRLNTASPAEGAGGDTKGRWGPYKGESRFCDTGTFRDSG